jgi:hypothetical protein
MYQFKITVYLKRKPKVSINKILSQVNLFVFLKITISSTKSKPDAEVKKSLANAHEMQQFQKKTVPPIPSYIPNSTEQLNIGKFFFLLI